MSEVIVYVPKLTSTFIRFMQKHQNSEGGLWILDEELVVDLWRVGRRVKPMPSMGIVNELWDEYRDVIFFESIAVLNHTTIKSIFNPKDRIVMPEGDVSLEFAKKHLGEMLNNNQVVFEPLSEAGSCSTVTT